MQRPDTNGETGVAAKASKMEWTHDAVCTAMDELAQEQQIFYSEADFQLTFAWILRSQHRIRLEAPFPSDDGSRRQIDIWLPDEHVGMEMKYPKSRFEFEDELGLVLLKGADEQEANCYNFWKDVMRLEYWKEIGRIDHGFAILLTNMSRMWKAPRKNDASAFREVRLFDGRAVSGTLHMHTGPRKQPYVPITLRGMYDVRWRDYCEVKGERFRYIVLAAA